MQKHVTGSSLRKAAVAVCGLLAGLLIAEVACKIHDVRTSRKRLRTVQSISRPSTIPGVRYELIPGVESITPGSPYAVRVNNLGFRGPDVKPEKGEGRFRIVILGDSISFGRMYDEQHIYPSILQQKLDAALPERDIEVINASMSGRDTWETRALLENRILPLSPDLVILQICLNDHIRLPAPEDTPNRGVFGERSWHTYSSLLLYMDQRIEGFRELRARLFKPFSLDNRTPAQVLANQTISPVRMIDVQSNWDAWSRELLAIQEITRHAGAHLLFAAFPIAHQVKNNFTEASTLLTELAASHGIPLFEVVGLLEGNPRKFMRDYTHLNNAGHRRVGAELALGIETYLRELDDLQQDEK
jgi:lysophospholipase L1-like esterase